MGGKGGGVGDGSPAVGPYGTAGWGLGGGQRRGAGMEESARGQNVRRTLLKQAAALGDQQEVFEAAEKVGAKQRSIEDLWSSHRLSTNQILDDLVAKIAPKRMTVEGDFWVRGGITTVVEVQHP